MPRAETGEADPERIPEVSEGLDSVIEAAFWETWQRTTRIHLTPQYPAFGYHIDFAHLPSKIAIELDGYYYHSDQERFRKDRQRDRELSLHGWRVHRFAAEEILESAQNCVNEAISLIQAHLARAGGRDTDISGNDNVSSGKQ